MCVGPERAAMCVKAFFRLLHFHTPEGFQLPSEPTVENTLVCNHLVQVLSDYCNCTFDAFSGNQDGSPEFGTTGHPDFLKSGYVDS